MRFAQLQIPHEPHSHKPVNSTVPQTHTTKHPVYFNFPARKMRTFFGYLQWRKHKIIEGNLAG